MDTAADLDIERSPLSVLETIGEADVLRNPERLLEKRGDTVPDIDVVGVLETESLGVEE